MGIKELYNDNFRKLPNEYGDVSVMSSFCYYKPKFLCNVYLNHRRIPPESGFERFSVPV